MSIILFLDDEGIDVQTRVIYEFKWNDYLITCELLDDRKILGNIFYAGESYCKVFKDQDVFLEFMKTLDSNVLDDKLNKFLDGDDD